MKHTLKITSILICLFFLAQLIGLSIIYQDLKIEKTVSSTGQIVINVTHPETVFGERPDVKNFDALILILESVLVGTGLILVIVKFGLKLIWKGLLFFAIFFSIGISLGTFLSPLIAGLIAFILAVLKVFKPNVFVHNLSEILVYSGIAVLFVPLLQPLWVFVLLLIISGYDMFAVWKSKHMIKLAEFQIGTQAFSGLFIQSSKKINKRIIRKSRGTVNIKNKSVSTDKTGIAVVGGGDIAFPLLFAGSVMEFLIVSGVGNLDAFLKASVTSVFATLALLGLMVYGKKGRYYPAMPFITAGCVLGYLITLFI